MTVGEDRLQIQDDILVFLESLDWGNVFIARLFFFHRYHNFCNVIFFTFYT